MVQQKLAGHDVAESAVDEAIQAAVQQVRDPPEVTPAPEIDDPDGVPTEPDSPCIEANRDQTVGLCRGCLENFSKQLAAQTENHHLNHSNLDRIHKLSFWYQLVSYTLRCSTSTLYPHCLPMAFAKDIPVDQCPDEEGVALIEERDDAAMNEIGFKKEYDATVEEDFLEAGTGTSTYWDFC